VTKYNQQIEHIDQLKSDASIFWSISPVWSLLQYKANTIIRNQKLSEYELKIN